MNEIGTDLIRNQIKNGLEGYDKVIDNADKNYNSLEILGRHDPSVPYLSKYSLSFFIDYHEKEGVELSELKKDYERISKKLIVLGQKRGKGFHDKVFDCLKFHVDQYPTMVCLFLRSDPIDLETENDLNGRDIIEILLMEFQKDYDVHDIKVKVSALDEVLKCKFKANFDVLMKECPYIEKPYYPENFWWRHPSKLHNLK